MVIVIVTNTFNWVMHHVGFIEGNDVVASHTQPFEQIVAFITISGQFRNQLTIAISLNMF